MPTRPIVAIADLPLEPRPAAWQPPATAKRRFDVKRARAAPLLGLKMLGCTLHEVGPGATAYPFHSHRANEELLVVLAGRGELRYGSATHPVREGDLIGCPAGGPETAHQLTNTGDAPLRYLAISTQIDPDICEYPDSGKVGAYAGDGKDALMHLSHYGSAVDYWVDE
ncbi:MAG TPA: cupin domain-containing protein [Burkholderiaceae bacterium]|nr:cupin domain-containing protein [Burkholderiaceae bacterium]